jgi:cystathionine beta-lyase
LRHNLTLANSLARQTLGVQTMLPQASYLLWMFFPEITDQVLLEKYCTHSLGLGLSSGTYFGQEGLGFMRLNFALPQENLIKVFEKF